MKQEDQATAFAEDLEALVDRYIQEFDLMSSSAIGVLQIQMHAILISLFERDDD